MSEFCPCGSTLQYNLCCEPYILGIKIAAEPGILMRSRYCAYVKHKADYLIMSWHPDCHAENWRYDIIEIFNNTKWHGLSVIAENVGTHIDEGFVEFIAHFSHKNSDQPAIIHERSRFIRLYKRWYYIEDIRP